MSTTEGAACPGNKYDALAAQIAAEVELKAATERAEDAAKDEDSRQRASREFAEAYYAWLTAKAAVQNPSVEDDEEHLARDLEAERAAERRLLTTPAAYPDHLWKKLEAFEASLTNELVSGPRTELVLLLGLGAIKADIHNLDICN